MTLQGINHREGDSRSHDRGGSIATVGGTGRLGWLRVATRFIVAVRVISVQM
jgi:hypothetical protein